MFFPFFSYVYARGVKFYRTAIVNNEPLSIKTAIKVSPFFGASIHATLRRLVEFSPVRCALLVMKDPMSTKATLRDLFYSQSFLSDIGDIRFNEYLDCMRYSFVKSYVRCVKSDHGKFLASVNESTIELRYEYFFNGYNGFVLIYP